MGSCFSCFSDDDSQFNTISPRNNSNSFIKASLNQNANQINRSGTNIGRSSSTLSSSNPIINQNSISQNKRSSVTLTPSLATNFTGITRNQPTTTQHKNINNTAPVSLSSSLAQTKYPRVAVTQTKNLNNITPASTLNYLSYVNTPVPKLTSFNPVPIQNRIVTNNKPLRDTTNQNQNTAFSLRQDRKRTHSPIRKQNTSNQFRNREISSNEEKYPNKRQLSGPVMRILKLVFQNDLGDDHSSAYSKLKQLESTIRLLPKINPEYEMILNYVRNTHGPTHTFRITVEHIYVAYRWGTLKDFKPMKRLGNRKLLWHGTRLSNYTSILSNGLLIQPPSNVPITGKMFGNGIYFADVVTKAAQYCYADKYNPYGILILAQVALGDEYVRTESEKVCKLPDGKNCVKGFGKYQHKENENARTKYGVEVPSGQLELLTNIKTNLLYNEYIVYNNEQILLEYLVLVKFNF